MEKLSFYDVKTKAKFDSDRLSSERKKRTFFRGYQIS